MAGCATRYRIGHHLRPPRDRDHERCRAGGACFSEIHCEVMAPAHDGGHRRRVPRPLHTDGPLRRTCGDGLVYDGQFTLLVAASFLLVKIMASCVSIGAGFRVACFLRHFILAF